MVGLSRIPQKVNMFEAERARRDFKLFVKLAWHTIEPGRPYVNGWHLDAIAEHLQAVYAGDITRLLVNMPPRHGKSTLITALWSAWLLLNNPSTRILAGSYAMSLATRDNLKARRIIRSNWFQDRYWHIFQMTKDQDAKLKFETDQLGYRMVTSVGASATGEGGDVLILDDPHNIDEKESNTKREAALDWFDNTWSSRLNDQQTGKMVVVAHRIHMDDVSGHILENNDGEWTHLKLPAEYDPATSCRTYTITGKEFWGDPRKEEGELLWPEKFPEKEIERAKRRHGPMGYPALFAQNPIIPGGYIFNLANERLFTIPAERDVYQLVTPSGVQIVDASYCYELTTSDVAAKDSEQNDFTVFAHWAVTPANDVLLLDLIRGQWSVPKQKEQARLFYRKWHSQRYRALYFEDVGYQSAIGQDLLTEGIPCLPFHPQGKGDKVMRAGGASIWQAAGKVYFLKNAVWLPDFQKEIYSFPRAKHDDQVDPFSMVCMLVRTPEIQELDDDLSQAINNYVGY